jgi:hypothetical protein
MRMTLGQNDMCSMIYLRWTSGADDDAENESQVNNAA